MPKLFRFLINNNMCYIAIFLMICAIPYYLIMGTVLLILPEFLYDFKTVLRGKKS